MNERRNLHWSIEILIFLNFKTLQKSSWALATLHWRHTIAERQRSTCFKNENTWKRKEMTKKNRKKRKNARVCVPHVRRHQSNQNELENHHLSDHDSRWNCGRTYVSEKKMQQFSPPWTTNQKKQTLGTHCNLKEKEKKPFRTVCIKIRVIKVVKKGAWVQFGTLVVRIIILSICRWPYALQFTFLHRTILSIQRDQSARKELPNSKD